MNIILLGAPGSGKGTQSEKLVANNGFTQFSTGDVMRKEIKEGTELGKECDKYIKEGKLVPNEIVDGMVANYLKTKHDGLIFDGYPRNVEQAKALDKMLADENSEIDWVFYIDVDKQILLDRISGRLICPKCKRSYHTTNRPPKVAGICDYDGAQLVRRADDAPEKVQVRLDTYEKETMPLIDYYKNKEKVIEVHASNNSPEPVYKAIVNTIDNGKKNA